MSEACSLEPTYDFAEFSATQVVEAFDFALHQGAAKLAEILTEDDLKVLDQGANDIGYILQQSDGLRKVVALLHGRDPETFSAYHGVGILEEESVGGSGQGWPNVERIHQDSLTRFGISLLVPLSENRGTFGADNNPLDLANNSWPSVLFGYKRGDIVILRQDTSSRNGSPLLPELSAEHPDGQAFHFGASFRARKLRIISLARLAEVA